MVVLSDADLDLAVGLTVKAGFGLTGQACTATSRVIVEDRVADDFVRALAQAAEALVVGNGLDSKTQMGPAVSREQMETDFRYIRLGQEEGAKLVAGGGRAGKDGFYVQPTVFDRVEPTMRIAQRRYSALWSASSGRRTLTTPLRKRMR
jgi:aldehyde dehydrogenase (NAD+)